MAQLTDNINDITRGSDSIVPIPSDKGVWNGVSGIADSLGSIFQNYQANATRNAARVRQANEDALKATDRSATNDTAQYLVDTFGNNGYQSVDDAVKGQTGNVVADGAQAITAATSFASDQASSQSAASQGRLTQAAVDVRATQGLQQLFAKYPNQRGIIFETLNKYGFDHPIMRQYEQAENNIKADNQNFLDAQKSAYDAAAKQGLDPSAMTTEEFLAKGRDYLQHQAELETLAKQTSINAQNVSTAQSEYTFNKNDRDDRVYRAVFGSFEPAVSGLMQKAQEIVSRTDISDQDKQKWAQQVVGPLTTDAKTRLNNQVQAAIRAGASPETIQRIQNDGKGLINNLNGIFNQPIEAVKNSVQVQQLLSTKLKLDTQAAMPLYNQLVTVFGNSAVANTFVQQYFATHPEKINEISTELKNLSALSPGQQTQHINTAIQLMSGQTNLQSLSPQQADGQMGTIINTYRALRPAAIAGDPMAKKTAINGLNHVSDAAMSLNQNTSRSSLQVATETLTSPNTVSLLHSVGRDNDVKVSTGAARAAVQNLFNSWSMVQTGDKYYDIKWNEKQGGYVAVRNDTPYEGTESNARYSNLYAGLASKTLAPTSDTSSKVAGLNKALNMLVRTSDIGGTGVPTNFSPKDLAKMYAGGALGAPSPSTKAGGTDNNGKPQKTGTQLMEDFRLQRLDSLRHSNDPVSLDIGTSDMSQEVAPKGHGPLSVDHIVSSHQSNPNIGLIRNAAKEFNVPEEIALNLTSVETGGSFKANLDNGKAFGLGQVTYGRKGTAGLYGLSDEQLKNLSAKDQARLSMQVLRDNFDHFGNWQDAVSAYHSGVDYKTAAAQGRNDGNMRTVDYVQRIYRHG